MLPEPVEADRRAFLQKAARDLRTAQRMAEEPGEFSDVVCFHAQQCAEKAFKALIVSGEMVVPRTHDLEILAELLSGRHPDVSSLDAACALLSDFGVAPRYPGWEPAVGSIDVPGVLAAAEKVLSWVVARTGTYGTELSSG